MDGRSQRLSGPLSARAKRMLVAAGAIVVLGLGGVGIWAATHPDAYGRSRNGCVTVSVPSSTGGASCTTAAPEHVRCAVRVRGPRQDLPAHPASMPSCRSRPAGGEPHLTVIPQPGLRARRLRGRPSGAVVRRIKPMHILNGCAGRPASLCARLPGQRLILERASRASAAGPVTGRNRVAAALRTSYSSRLSSISAAAALLST